MRSRKIFSSIFQKTRGGRPNVQYQGKQGASRSIHHQARPLQPFLLERFDGWDDSTLSLSSSECEPLSLKELLTYADDQGMERWESLSLGYVEPAHGSEDVREAVVAAQFKNNSNNNASAVDAGCVNICAPQEGIFLALHALGLQPGDHVIAVAPAYQSLHEIAASLGCEVDLWWPEEMETEVTLPSSSSDDTSTTSTKTVKSMTFRPETLQSLVRPGNTKLVVGNFPHNPTGALPSSTEFQSMIDTVSDPAVDAWFLVDEMYQGLEHPNSSNASEHNARSPQYVPPLPSIATCLPKGISLGGLSKSYGLPGLRVGWLVNTLPRFQQRVKELKDYTTICPPAPSESLALIALRAQPDLWHRNRTILAEGLPVLRQFVLEQKSLDDKGSLFDLEWCEPRGGTFAWVKMVPSLENAGNHTTTTASEYSQGVRQRTGLMMVPSGLFAEYQADDMRDDRLRLTFGKKGLKNLLQVWQNDICRTNLK